MLSDGRIYTALELGAIFVNTMWYNTWKFCQTNQTFEADLMVNQYQKGIQWMSYWYYKPITNYINIGL